MNSPDDIRGLWDSAQRMFNIRVDFLPSIIAAPSATCVFLPDYGSARGIVAVCMDSDSSITEMMVESIASEFTGRKVSIMFFHGRRDLSVIQEALDDWKFFGI